MRERSEAATSIRANAGSPIERRLLAWLFARLAVAVLVLLGATFLVTARYSFTRDAMFTLDVVLFGSSTIGLLGLVRRTPGSVELLLVVDLVVTTALLWLTGAAASPLAFLYGLLTLAGAMVGGPTTALAVAGSSIALFLGISWSVISGALPPPPDQLGSVVAISTTELATFTLSNIVGITAVAALATNLALRVEAAGGQLADAERTVAELTRRNVDIVRSLTSGLVTTSPDGLIESMNPSAVAMFHAEEGVLIGQPIERFLPQSRAHPRTEGVAQRPDGTTFPVGFREAPLVDAAGSVTGAVITLQDLTEVNRLRKQAAESERLAELGKLAAGLAHEIRNPLTSISGSVELIRESASLGADEQRLLGIVLRETERLNALVATMLRVARPSRPATAQVDLGALCTEIVSIARVEAADIGVGIELTVGDGTSDEATTVVVLGDDHQLRQVLWNLLRNALQASVAGQQISVSVQNAGPNARLEVRDHGAGLSADAQAHVFEMFYSGRSHGTGLGLTLVQQIVRDHGGSISAGNVEDGSSGALFCVLLPKLALAQVESSADASHTPRVV